MKCVLACLLAIIICTVSPLLDGEATPAHASDVGAAKTVTVTFVSATGEQVTATFDREADSVSLVLPDSSTIRLPRAMSASGARYANDRMVFWEHQGKASLWIDDKLIFTGAPQQ